MDDRTRRALSRGHLIDITTTGRGSGRPRRIEIVFHVIDGRIYISGMPGRARSWLANMRTDPRFTFHLKGVVRADLPAVARPITDELERRRIFAEIVKVWRNQDVETMVAHSPLVEVTIQDLAA
ncbi:MAG: nitroreductase family deazaflavin-dependent oxidoreductase [Chloroflexi bacterium]|nr:MAG: nitroreductase family deazaflavin-dependent oxidoreductase [Chloroflexota bacterium]